MSPHSAISIITALLLLLAPKPRVQVSGPHMVLRRLSGPTEVLIRVKFIDAPECFGVGVNWGDGELSAWQTCEETSWSKPHKYKIAGDILIVASLWGEDEKGKPKMLARAEHQLTISE